MPALTHHVAVGDAMLRVQRIAPGEPSGAPPIVFLHDSLGCVETWRDFPACLGERTGREAIVYDRRGYGRSSPMGEAPPPVDYLEREADVLFQLLDALGVERAVFFGHSAGGSIALLAAATCPDRIAAVVTEGAHVLVEERMLDGLRDASVALANTDLRDRIRRHHGDHTDRLLSAWIDTRLQPHFRDWNIESFLPRITAPVLAIQGEDDEYGTLRQVDAIVRGVGANARGLMLPSCAHTPHRDAAEVVLDAVSALLREVE